MKMFSTIFLLTVATIISCFQQYSSYPFNEEKVTYLHVDTPHMEAPFNPLSQMSDPEIPIHIYCRRNQDLQCNNIFQRNQLRLEIKPNTEYKQYKAQNAKGIYQEHHRKRECQEDKLFAGEQQTLHYIWLPSHDHYCYGIQTKEAYTITLLQVKLDWKNLACFVIGLILWLFSTPDLLGKSFTCASCIVFVLGGYVINALLIVAVLINRDEFQLQHVAPVVGNTLSLLNLYPTSISLLLVAEVYVLKKICNCLEGMWQSDRVRENLYNLLRAFSYMLILSGSDHWYFKWGILSVMLPWPEILLLIHMIVVQCKKKYRSMFPPKVRVLLTYQAFKRSSSFETLEAIHDIHGVVRNRRRVRQPMDDIETVEQFSQLLDDANSNVPVGLPPPPPPTDIAIEPVRKVKKNKDPVATKSTSAKTHRGPYAWNSVRSLHDIHDANCC